MSTGLSTDGLPRAGITQDNRFRIEVGGRAALIAVRCPETLDDVEEYLLTGIDFEEVAVLDSQDTH